MLLSMSNNKYKFDLEDNTTSNGDNNTNQQPQSQSMEEDYSVAEINLGNIKGPVVIFFGPVSSGKTVTLVRLAKYLKNQSNTVKINSGFREDSGYDKVKEAFNDTLKNTNFAPSRTQNINFLLLDIYDKGSLYCQFLEAPGEHYFSLDKPDYEPYFYDILNSSYKKVYVFFFERGMFGARATREDYANKITELLNGKIKHKRDKIIILFNKIDEYQEIFEGGRPNEKTLKDWVYGEEEYTSLKQSIKRSNLKNVLFVPFSSGNFTSASNNRKRWILSSNEYPQKLWKAIRYHLDKRWF